MATPQRIIGVAIIILALVIGIVPAFYNCEAYGDAAATTDTTMAGGMTTTTVGGMGGSSGTSDVMAAPMRCYYSSKTAVLVAIPLGILGLLLLLSRRKETTRLLAVMGIALGAVTMAVPSLVGTCGMATMICNEVLKPTMLLAGGLVIALNVILLVLGERRRESTV